MRAPQFQPGGVGRVDDLMPNRLAQETSPYLQQHKDNPVDWWPWSDEAFAEARTTDRPVLLSIGYSRVPLVSRDGPRELRERNRRRRDERTLRQHQGRPRGTTRCRRRVHGGHAGDDRRRRLAHDRLPAPRRPAVLRWHVLPPVVAPWTARVRGGHAGGGRGVERTPRRPRRTSRGAHDERAGPFAAVDGEHQHALDDSMVGAAVPALRGIFEPEWGGFGRAPKFPQVELPRTGARHHAHHGDADSLGMLTTTLDAMASGGIYDHLGGGFARYSVDAFWMVPHFEKMLYDQAQLVRAYLHGWQVTGDAAGDRSWRRPSRTSLRDLGTPTAGCSRPRTPTPRAKRASSTCGGPRRLARGARRRRSHGRRHRVVRRHPVGQLRRLQHPPPPARGDLLRSRRHREGRAVALLARRSRQRVRPGLDDKVLTEWNAMFVSRARRSRRCLRRTDWIDAAAATADFLLGQPPRATGGGAASGRTSGGTRATSPTPSTTPGSSMPSRGWPKPRGEARWIDARPTSRRCAARPLLRRGRGRPLHHRARRRAVDRASKGLLRRRHAFGQRRGCGRAAPPGRAHRRRPVSRRSGTPSSLGWANRWPTTHKPSRTPWPPSTLSLAASMRS